MLRMGHDNNDLRGIPSVDRLLTDLGSVALSRPVVVDVARDLVNEMRRAGRVPAYEAIVRKFQQRVNLLSLSRLQPVVNATGICLHTNLGRAPLSARAVHLMSEVAAGYSNLEFDVAEGVRGCRGSYVERCLGLLTGSSGVAIVNNCAAALFLILNQFARDSKPEVIISRGELVQIGGGFRIPEILSSSGAIMREVGTTNRTTIDDFEEAITDQTGLILRVHRSNFYMEGFVERPTVAEVADLGKRANVLVVYDQGSGAMVDTSTVQGAAKELTPHDALAAGVDLVCFSADKLFGGPQAGVICGDKDQVGVLKKNPLYRVLRSDKLALSALQATAEAYLENGTEQSNVKAVSVPVLQCLSVDLESLRKRGQAIARQLQRTALEVELQETVVEVGGGTLPRSQVPSIGLRIRVKKYRPQDVAARMRQMVPVVIGYVADDRFWLDLRAVFSDQDAVLVNHLVALENQGGVSASAST
ncbi:MAG: L-seryl-tRNA(Sec) selenium transferase [Verrucomicrobia subdivision 3 bacterium]|nr:L-seryl-tRNA(Sec) selenium transferase [Limisphaerales bacterium]MCS1413407.1 L-seryl-tRNA(Sec) selenium transferase [Limisphaerales bacterium]